MDPAAVTVALGGTVQFGTEQEPSDAFGGIAWALSGTQCAVASCGTIDADGRYVAPLTAPGAGVTVTATSMSNPAISASAAITIGPQAAGTFTSTGNMAIPRAGHTATLLEDGRVLIAGGSSYMDGAPPAERSAELYDPATGMFSATGSMAAPRAGHSATLLPSGLVLIAGGSGSTSGVELFDPATGTFVSGGVMLTQQGIGTATLLGNDTVLVAGDVDAELYSPVSRTFRRAGPYAVDGDYPTVTLLADGRVLFAGHDPAQIYDPLHDAFSITGRLSATGIYGLEQHSATLLADGRVLIAGGSNDEFPAGRVGQAELYDPATGVFSRTGDLIAARDLHDAVRLADGQVFIVGGEGNRCTPNYGCQFGGSLASAELYAPSTGSFATVGSMSIRRSEPRATMLKNGDVLITGGFSYCGIDCFLGAVAAAELYRPR